MQPQAKDTKDQDPKKSGSPRIYTSGPLRELPAEARKEMADTAWRQVAAAMRAGAAIGWSRPGNTWHYPLGTIRGRGSVSYKVHVSIHWSHLQEDYIAAFAERPRDPFEVLTEVFRDVLYHITIEVNRIGQDNPHWYSRADEGGRHWLVPIGDPVSQRLVEGLRAGNSDFQFDWERLKNEAAKAIATLKANPQR